MGSACELALRRELTRHCQKLDEWRLLQSRRPAGVLGQDRDKGLRRDHHNLPDSPLAHSPRCARDSEGVLPSTTRNRGQDQAPPLRAHAPGGCLQFRLETRRGAPAARSSGRRVLSLAEVSKPPPTKAEVKAQLARAEAENKELGAENKELGAEIRELKAWAETTVYKQVKGGRGGWARVGGVDALGNKNLRMPLFPTPPSSHQTRDEARLKSHAGANKRLGAGAERNKGRKDPPGNSAPMSLMPGAGTARPSRPGGP